MVNFITSAVSNNTISANTISANTITTSYVFAKHNPWLYDPFVNSYKTGFDYMSAPSWLSDAALQEELNTPTYITLETWDGFFKVMRWDQPLRYEVHVPYLPSSAVQFAQTLDPNDMITCVKRTFYRTADKYHYKEEPPTPPKGKTNEQAKLAA